MSYYANYKPDGTPFVWVPTYRSDKPINYEKIAGIIYSGLLSAPIADRKIVGQKIKEFAEAMLLTPNDPNRTVVIYGIDNTYVVLLGGKAYGNIEIQNAINRTSIDLMKYIGKVN